MITFCTRCWAELDDSVRVCPRCGADLSSDNRSYHDKLIGALNHPLPEARARACWLLGSNAVDQAADALMKEATTDEDLFVRHAAVEALGHLRSPRIPALLNDLRAGEDHRMSVEAERSLQKFELGDSTPGKLP